MEKNETKATNTIAYKGTVTIKRIGKNGKVKSSTITHNTGKQGLFNFLLYSLAYQYDSKRAPYALMGYSGDGADKTAAFSKFVVQNHAPTLYRKVSGEGSNVTYKQTKAVPVHRVEYSFLVPSSIVTAKTITMFRLIDTAAVMEGNLSTIDENRISAEINLLESPSGALAPGNDNLLIYWDLEFSNAASSASNSSASTAEIAGITAEDTEQANEPTNND